MSGLLSYALAGAGKGAADTYLEISKEDRADKKEQEAEKRAAIRQDARDKRLQDWRVESATQQHDWQTEAADKVAKAKANSEDRAAERFRISEDNKNIRSENRIIANEQASANRLAAEKAMNTERLASDEKIAGERVTTVSDTQVAITRNPEFDPNKPVNSKTNPTHIRVDSGGKRNTLTKEERKAVADAYTRIRALAKDEFQDAEDGVSIVSNDNRANYSRAVALGEMYYDLTGVSPGKIMPEILAKIRKDSSLNLEELTMELNSANNKLAGNMVGDTAALQANVDRIQRQLDQNKNPYRVNPDDLNGMKYLSEKAQKLLSQGGEGPATPAAPKGQPTEKDTNALNSYIRTHALKKGDKFRYKLEDGTYMDVTVE